ncbi:MAG: FeoA family protein [Desulfocapsaceae bacterium]|jgi:Fe2+ transport system protein FeoA|nr:FeoA family protein [Desulfocapsaceae bacterium]
MVNKFFGCGRKKMRRMQGRDCASQTECQVTPLSKKINCGVARVCSINGDRRHCARLASLGLYPGNEIELVCPSHGDGCIIKVHGGTVLIDKETMENILVSE